MLSVLLNGVLYVNTQETIVLVEFYRLVNLKELRCAFGNKHAITFAIQNFPCQGVPVGANVFVYMMCQGEHVGFLLVGQPLAAHE